MADIIAFEIQIYKGGAWKIDSVFDNKELAIFEAKRLNDAGRYSGVRVVQETYEESSGLSKIRILYRGSKIEESKPEPVKKAPLAKPKQTRGPRNAPSGTFKKQSPRKKSAGQGSSIGQVIQFIGIAIIIGGFIYFLQTLKEGM